MPHARSPLAGSIISYPASFNFRILACTIGLPHIFVFIEGTKNTGTVVAMTIVVKKSSAIPLATFPIMFAVAGTITSWSAISESVI